MPIYEYQCQSCGTVKEMMQKISDPGPESCLSCNQGPMVKLMSKTGFILKGSGWYVTDFRDSNKKNGAAATDKPVASEGGEKPATETGTPSKSDTSSASGGDSKPAATTSSTPASTGSPSASKP